MNFTPIFGWYYLSESERTASWTGVQYFYNFITTNKGPGPFGTEVGEQELLAGDVVQLYNPDVGYYHTLLVVGFSAEDIPLVAAQSDDAFERGLDTYTFESARYIHIDGVRQMVDSTEDCYESLLAGISIIPSY